MANNPNNPFNLPDADVQQILQALQVQDVNNPPAGLPPQARAGVAGQGQPGPQPNQPGLPGPQANLQQQPAAQQNQPGQNLAQAAGAGAGAAAAGAAGAAANQANRAQRQFSRFAPLGSATRLRVPRAGDIALRPPELAIQVIESWVKSQSLFTPEERNDAFLRQLFSRQKSGFSSSCVYQLSTARNYPACSGTMMYQELRQNNAWARILPSTMTRSVANFTADIVNSLTGGQLEIALLSVNARAKALLEGIPEQRQGVQQLADPGFFQQHLVIMELDKRLHPRKYKKSLKAGEESPSSYKKRLIEALNMLSHDAHLERARYIEEIFGALFTATVSQRMESFVYQNGTITLTIVVTRHETYRGISDVAAAPYMALLPEDYVTNLTQRTTTSADVARYSVSMVADPRIVPNPPPGQPRGVQPRVAARTDPGDIEETKVQNPAWIDRTEHFPAVRKAIAQWQDKYPYLKARATARRLRVPGGGGRLLRAEPWRMLTARQVEVMNFNDPQEIGACDICMHDYQIGCFFVFHCGHVMCSTCYPRWEQQTCPMCRAPIQHRRRQEDVADAAEWLQNNSGGSGSSDDAQQDADASMNAEGRALAAEQQRMLADREDAPQELRELTRAQLQEQNLQLAMQVTMVQSQYAQVEQGRQQLINERAQLQAEVAAAQAAQPGPAAAASESGRSLSTEQLLNKVVEMLRQQRLDPNCDVDEDLHRGFAQLLGPATSQLYDHSQGRGNPNPHDPFNREEVKLPEPAIHNPHGDLQFPPGMIRTLLQDTAPSNVQSRAKKRNPLLEMGAIAESRSDQQLRQPSSATIMALHVGLGSSQHADGGANNSGPSDNHQVPPVQRMVQRSMPFSQGDPSPVLDHGQAPVAEIEEAQVAAQQLLGRNNNGDYDVEEVEDAAQEATESVNIRPQPIQMQAQVHDQRDSSQEIAVLLQGVGAGQDYGVEMVRAVAGEPVGGNMPQGGNQAEQDGEEEEDEDHEMQY